MFVTSYFFSDFWLFFSLDICVFLNNFLGVIFVICRIFWQHFHPVLLIFYLSVVSFGFVEIKLFDLVKLLTLYFRLLVLFLNRKFYRTMHVEYVICSF